ncbi:nucleoporin p54-like [Saccostrea echinata]|uniref:nucleoporin p54-like n=1 Tax=Saccostrea echinata TaxID=191078 RepID=UPI002A7FF220|nr:nucleoporin p54-like [Saccostrea echinata]XP_061189373.1 nucleoporin p54-like [Saccostrea echinata]
MAFSLGGGATPFGGTSTTSSAPFFGFGTSTQSSGGFGTQAKTTAATGFSFGTPAATSATGFSFGGAPATSTSTGFSFGGAPATTTSTGFSFGGTGAGTSAFGGATGFPSFGGGLGGTGTTTTGQSSFGFGLGTQQTNPLQVQQPPTSNLENIATAVTLPQIYGDERDAIIAKWNQLQAAWGTGKGIYSQQGSVEFTPDNPYCRFKAVGYNRLPKTKNEDGLVSLFIKKPEAEVRANQQQIVDTLFGIFGSKPQLSVCVEGIKKLPDNMTEFAIYILERPATGPARRIPANETCNFLNNQVTQLKSKLVVENVVPKMGFTEQALKEYLDTPPAGIHPFLWEQAKLDNPDPENLIPVPMIGFKTLHQRLKHQEQQTQAHQQRLDIIAEDLESLQQKQVNMLAKLEEYKRKHIQLSHRLLQVVVKQEISRKMGYSIQPEEEQLRVQLEKIQLELNHPTQFKGRLNELMSQIRMQNHLAATRADVSYQMDPSLQQEIKQLLKQQQDGLKHLVDIIKEDAQDVQLMEQNLEASSFSQR